MDSNSVLPWEWKYCAAEKYLTEPDSQGSTLGPRMLNIRKAFIGHSEKSKW